MFVPNISTTAIVFKYHIPHSTYLNILRCCSVHYDTCSLIALLFSEVQSVLLMKMQAAVAPSTFIAMHFRTIPLYLIDHDTAAVLEVVRHLLCQYPPTIYCQSMSFNMDITDNQIISPLKPTLHSHSISPPGYTVDYYIISFQSPYFNPYHRIMCTDFLKNAQHLFQSAALSLMWCLYTIYAAPQSGSTAHVAPP